MNLLDKNIKKWNSLVKVADECYEMEICHVPYVKTLNYILSGEDYDTQIRNYIKQIKDGYNSIDYDFIEWMDSDLNTHDSDEELVFNEIKHNYSFEQFQAELINETEEYYLSYIEE